jgi:predicted dehydrogenase
VKACEPPRVWVQAARFRDCEELLVSCLPNCLHVSVAITATKAKRHIYLEKPLAVTLQEGQAVLQARKSTSLMAVVGFKHRFNADCVLIAGTPAGMPIRSMTRT